MVPKRRMKYFPEGRTDLEKHRMGFCVSGTSLQTNVEES